MTIEREGNDWLCQGSKEARRPSGQGIIDIISELCAKGRIVGYIRAPFHANDASLREFKVYSRDSLQDMKEDGYNRDLLILQYEMLSGILGTHMATFEVREDSSARRSFRPTKLREVIERAILKLLDSNEISDSLHDSHDVD